MRAKRTIASFTKYTTKTSVMKITICKIIILSSKATIILKSVAQNSQSAAKIMTQSTMTKWINIKLTKSQNSTTLIKPSAQFVKNPIQVMSDFCRAHIYSTYSVSINGSSKSHSVHSVVNN